MQSPPGHCVLETARAQGTEKVAAGVGSAGYADRQRGVISYASDTWIATQFVAGVSERKNQNQGD